jgi:hypothetical protein
MSLENGSQCTYVLVKGVGKLQSFWDYKALHIWIGHWTFGVWILNSCWILFCCSCWWWLGDCPRVGVLGKLMTFVDIHSRVRLKRIKPKCKTKKKMKNLEVHTWHISLFIALCCLLGSSSLWISSLSLGRYNHLLKNWSFGVG